MSKLRSDSTLSQLTEDQRITLYDWIEEHSFDEAITRAAKLVKREGATYVYALVTHGVFSGDALIRLNASPIDKVIVTNSVPQEEHKALCPKLEVLEIGGIFAESIRRVYHGESISVLFQYD